MSSVKFSLLALIALLAVNIYPGWINKWYITWPFFDTALHFLGGFFVAMLIYSFYQNDFKKSPFFFQAIALLGITMGIGVIWEFTEYIANQTLVEPLKNMFQVQTYFIGTLDDTIEDLFMDFVGGLTFVIFYFINKRLSRP